jgi:hypothetical protein
MGKCTWENVHGKMYMGKCTWENVHGKMDINKYGI